MLSRFFFILEISSNLLGTWNTNAEICENARKKLVVGSCSRNDTPKRKIIIIKNDEYKE